MDMNLMAPNLSTIAEEFGMDDDERDVKLGGMIALGFFFVGAPVSFLVGWLADSINRSPLFAVTVFVGEVGCLGAAFVTSYPQLYVCRVLTGISIGGAIPVIYSVLGDLYPANKRSAISAVVTTGTGIGAGIGQVLAGSIKSWRLPFIIVAVPGLLCSILLLGIKDPERGASEAAWAMEEVDDDSTLESSTVLQDDDMKTSTCACDVLERGQNPQLEEEHTSHANAILTKCVTCESTKELMKIPTVILTILQAAPGALPFGFVSTFLNDFLQEQRGMTKQEATGVLLTFGVGNAVGVILSGFLGHFAYKKDIRAPPLIMGTSLILGCIPFYFLVNNVQGNNVGLASAVTVLSGILVVIPVPLERSILTNVCLPRLRGRSNAIVCIADDLGKGLGPALVSLLITSFDRQTAFNISLIGWIVGGVLSLSIVFFVVNDEARVQQQLLAQMREDANNDP
jgi:MFS family permease